MIRAHLLRLVCAALLLGVAAASHANQRIALVIGNNDYADSPLFNPVNDARAISTALREVGFETIVALDADLATMQSSLLEFSSRIEEDATALVYFAGHGIQARGENFLVPVDASLASESALRFEALNVADVLEELEYSDSKLNVLVLDACRNNPFLQRVRGGSRGLAAIDAAAGTLIAYATAPGSVASDGSEGNGLYTQHLLRAMRVPGLKVEEVFKQVRVGVSEDSDGQQIPWESSSLTGDFIFKNDLGADGSESPATLAAASANAAAPALPTAPGVEAETVFFSAIAEDDLDGYEAYLQQFPDGVYAPLASARAARLKNARGQQCVDLAGHWQDRTSDRSCASDLWLEVVPGSDGKRFTMDKDACPADGALALLGRTRASGEYQRDGNQLSGTWVHGPCSGVVEMVLSEDCRSAVGRVRHTAGLGGACQGEYTTRIERTDSPAAAP